MAGASTWIVKDPLTLEHFQFTAAEYSLMEALRHPTSISQLQRVFARKFPPQTISPPAVWDFIRRLYEVGLVVSDQAGQGQEILAHARRERARRRSLAWLQILAIRFRGFDPDRLLTAAYARLRWLYSPISLFLFAAMIVYACALIIGHFAEFRERLPALSDLARPGNLPWLLAAMGTVKVLHELGHAMMCKRYGGEVRELGFMLLALSPCLYCDVTDAWRLPSRRQRIAVSAAGMMVELLLAALATIVWWHSQPGVIQLVALDVMLVCTVGTLLVNGNPLLRYDGYYILSDLTETPNLWQRSREVLRQFIADRFLARRAGAPAVDDDPLAPRGRIWLAAYAIASKVYLTFVCAAIVWGLVVVLYPLYLQNLAYAIGLTVLGGAVVGPLSRASRFLRNPIRRSELRRGRLALAGALALSAIAVLLAWPVTYFVRAPLVLLPADATRVYATVEGTLVEALPAGEKVVAGQQLAMLDNAAIQLDLARMEGQHRLQELRVAHFERLRAVDPAAGDKLPTARAALIDLEQRLADRRQEMERLSLVAPQDGTVIPVPRTGESDRAMGRLPAWSGAILEPRNRHAHVEAGTLVCLVGEPNRLSAVLFVEDQDVGRLHSGQPVRLRLDQLPGRVLTGSVVEVARHEAEPAGGDAAARDVMSVLVAGLAPPERGRLHYEVRVKFDPPSQPLVIGGRGSAKIEAERITLARRLWRFVAQTFRLPM
jgi:putative peptide zinc metalloprotease protein